MPAGANQYIMAWLSCQEPLALVEQAMMYVSLDLARRT